MNLLDQSVIKKGKNPRRVQLRPSGLPSVGSPSIAGTVRSGLGSGVGAVSRLRCCPAAKRKRIPAARA